MLDDLEAPRHAVGEAPPYASVTEFKADLDILHDSLVEHNSALIARGRLRRLRRAVAVFGFYLAPLDLRQNSAVHDHTVAELFAAATPDIDYLALEEEARVALLLQELATSRPLVSPFIHNFWRERLQKCVLPVATVFSSEARFIHAIIKTFPVSWSWTIAGTSPFSSNLTVSRKLFCKS